MNSFRAAIDGVDGDLAIVDKKWLRDVEQELKLGNSARLQLAMQKGIARVTGEILTRVAAA